jgi:acyl carrier protein
MQEATKVTQEEIVEIVRIQLGASKVRPDNLLIEDLDAESADLVNIIASIEDRYGIKVDEEELATIATVADIFELVQGCLGRNR